MRITAICGGLLAWGMGFLAMAGVTLLGPFFLYYLGSETPPRVSGGRS